MDTIKRKVFTTAAMLAIAITVQAAATDDRREAALQRGVKSTVVSITFGVQ